MVRIKLNCKKRLKKKLIILVILLIILFFFVFLVNNVDTITNQIIVKELNIGVDNEE